MITENQPGAMQPVCFTVAGRAVPWSRVGHKGLARFTPPPVRHYQAEVKAAAALAMAGRNLIACPLDLVVMFYLAVPRGWPKWRQAAALAGHVRPAIKPDLDNLIKCIKDACNQVVYRDDSQIVEIKARKRYARRPGASVIVAPTGGIITSNAAWQQHLQILTPAPPPVGPADLFADEA